MWTICLTLAHSINLEATKPINMKVHITLTPKYSLDELKEITSLLKQIPGELEFNLGGSLTTKQLALGNTIWKDIDEIVSLSFDELFQVCDTYRAVKDIPEEDYVVVVTSFRNDRNWFSAFNGKNIFVHGDGWEYYTKRDSKFGVAQQIVENIFQSQIELDINDIENEPNIHMESIGCINDMCSKKTEILLKLRTADICDSCLDRAEEKNVNPLILQHISVIIRTLREAFVNSNRIKSTVRPKDVLIDSDRSIKIGESNVDLHPLNKVLFIFFLKNLQGIETKLVCEYQEDLYNIYKEIRDDPERMPIKRMFESVSGANPTFEIVKSRLNRALVEQLGGQLAEYYILTTLVIKDGINKYKINLEDEYIKIEPSKRKG